MNNSKSGKVKTIPPINAEHTVKLIADFIRTRVQEAGLKGVVIGLSGGIDSAVVSSIAVKALGAENVHGLFLPSSTTPKGDLEDVLLLCKKLGISLIQVDIQNIIQAFSEAIKEKELPTSMEWVNVKPRLRQSIWYYYANKLKCLVCGGGNKSELMIGYFTKFGDGAVDILPIGDVYKTNVFQLGEYLDVPKNILNKAPSAGLWSGQTDEDEIGMSYSLLDSILSRIERFQTDEEIASSLEISLSQVKTVRSLVYKSEHKRRGPIILKLGIRTPNNDWRVPLVEPSRY
ncbi:MAG: NAD+ synthase [Candidatus Hodarchaeales archaeon]